MPTLPASGTLIKELRALGNMCRYQGDFTRAEQHFRLALSLYESSPSENHTDAMLCLMALVQLLDRQGKEQQAREVEASIPALNRLRRSS